jgi:pyruvate,water dikinase
MSSSEQDRRTVHRARYESFRELLRLNRSALAQLAELEHSYYGGQALGLAALRAKCAGLIGSTRALSVKLADLEEGARPAQLLDACARIDEGVRPLLLRAPLPTGPLVVPLSALGTGAELIAGSKATNLAVAHSVLRLPTPAGFAFTTAAYARFLTASNLLETIESQLAAISGEEEAEDVDLPCAALQALVLGAPVPGDLADVALEAFDDLAAQSGSGLRVAVRSSAVGEDTSVSFAGQYATVLDVGRDRLLDAFKEVVASKFSPRAVVYRLRNGLDDWDVPMSVLVLQMVRPRVAGVLYTANPATRDARSVAIHAVEGLAERLVAGETASTVVYVERDTAVAGHPPCRVRSSHFEAASAILSASEAMDLARAGIALESHFDCPQDVEWAIDGRGAPYILQSRPLHIASVPRIPRPKLTLLVSGGEVASPGWAVGQVFVPRPGRSMPDGAVLVAESASPDLAREAGRAGAIVTEAGTIACHLASVARELGVPAVVGMPGARRVLDDGAEVTLIADEQGAALYAGRDEDVARRGRWRRRVPPDGPMMLRMRAVLDWLAPLHLKDPGSPEFTPEGCRTIHDIIRVAHESAMRDMFRLPASAAGSGGVAKLRTRLPLDLYVVDLGGGLDPRAREAPDDGALLSTPLQAVWRGFSHPGIQWSGPANMDVRGFMAIMAESAVSSPDALQDASSYALIASDYLNLSARFGYHFANVVSLCGDSADENYVSLQFSGGVGSFDGRSLRAQFVAAVLERLGFHSVVRGDLVEATLKSGEKTGIQAKLDQVGRLLASTRLLDVSIHRHEQIGEMTEMFFAGDYDFLRHSPEGRVEGFYVHSGTWSRAQDAGETIIVQDGTEWGSGLTGGVTRLMRRVVGGARYQAFLDNVKAYHYFPKLIAKDGEVESGTVTVRVRPVAGIIDQAAGLVFGLRNAGNYFALRVNALENNLILFETVDGTRMQRAAFERTIEPGRWYRLTAVLSGRRVEGFLDDERLVAFEAERTVAGHVGLWTKADSLSHFAGLKIERGERCSG